MRRAGVFAPLCVGALSCALWGQGSPCEALHPLPDSSYQYKDRGNRCEGFYVADVGVNTLELVSFQLGQMNDKFKSGERLQISVPGQTQAVRVRAAAVPMRTYYRMDALLLPGATLIWPVDDVLIPAHLNPERLGVFAWKGDEANKVLLPVRIVSTASGIGKARDAVPSLTFRPSFDIVKIKWRSSPVSAGHCSAAGPWRDLPSGQVVAGQCVKLSLVGLRGEYCIEVAAQGKISNDWYTSRIPVEIPLE